MTASRRPLALAFLLGLMTATPAARAGLFTGRDDCAPGTRHARAEWECEFRNSKRFEAMNFAELTGYAESYRTQLNRQILNTYHRPVAESAPAARP